LNEHQLNTSEAEPNPYQTPDNLSPPKPVRVKSYLAGPLLGVGALSYLFGFMVSFATVVPEKAWFQNVTLASLFAFGTLGIVISFHLSRRGRASDRDVE